MLYLGVDGEVDLGHHSVHFADDYRRNVKEITELGVLSEDASIYIHNPSVIDKTLAPPGKSSLYVLMPVPNLSADINWEQEHAEVEDWMMQRLQQIPQLAGIAGRVEESLFFSPLDWQNQQNVYNGATFNLAHNLGQMMHLRPHNTFEEVRGIWLVGGEPIRVAACRRSSSRPRSAARLLREHDQAVRGRFTVQAGAPGAGAGVPL